MNQSESARKVALVTGGRRGIGRGISYALADRGFDVAIVDVVEDDAAKESLAGLRERGGRGIFVKADISDLRSHEVIAECVWSQLGPVNCLVNNAGVQTLERGDMLEVSPDNFDRLININLRGTFFLTQYIAKRMIQEDAGDALKPDRSIVILSSNNAVLAMPGQADYCISKSALTMTSTLFALRLAPHGITVNEIRPGITQTDMTLEVFEKYDRWIKEGSFPQSRWGQPEDVGKTVALLATGQLPYATGQSFHVDGGLSIRRA